MEVFTNPDGRRSFIPPGFCTTSVFEIFDEMRHMELRFRFGRKITRVLLWESQRAHSEIQSTDNVEFYEIRSSRMFPIYFLGISLIVNSNHMIGPVIRAEKHCEPSKTLYRLMIK
jgi:hypothetical protein